MKKIRRYIRLLKIISPDYILGTVGIILLIIFFVFTKYFPVQPQIKPIETVALTVFDALSLQAKAVYVYDMADQRELYSRNSNAQLPLASLTKIMMTVTTLSILPQNSIITIDANALKSEGNSGLMDNERFHLVDLIELTLLESSNDGASAIANSAGSSGILPVSDNFGRGSFVDSMNILAGKLDMNQTYFLNPTGLDETTGLSGAYGSAKDVANLFSYAISKYPEIFGVTTNENREFESVDLLKHKVKNTNTFVSKIPSLLASKTGYTDLAGGNLVIAFDAGVNHPIIVSVLGSTEKGRFEDAEKLVFASLEFLKTN